MSLNLTEVLKRKEQERRAALAVPAESAPTPVAPTDSAPAARPDAPLQIEAPAEIEPTQILQGRWTPVFNEFFDRIAPTLDPLESLIVLQLWRLTAGFEGRQTCRIGYPKLAEKCGVRSQNTVRAACRRLEHRGLIRAVRVESAAANSERGTVWEVLLNSPAVGAKTAGAKTAGAKSAPAAVAPMKENHEKSLEKPTVPEIRLRAARLHEIERLTGPELAEAVFRGYVAEGLSVTREGVAAALAGSQLG
jgi:hypothetical protein